MSRGTLDSAVPLLLSLTGLSPSLAGLPRAILLAFTVTFAVRTPGRTRPGLGSSHFARRYFENRCFFFLFLRLLRCFSSPGSLPYTMDSCMGDGGFLRRVSPFRHPRIYGYLRLPAAFRSLSRLSSALSAKASTLRSWSFNLSSFPYSHGFVHSLTEMADGICIPSLPFTSSVMLLGSSAWSASASQVFRLSRLPLRPRPCGLRLPSPPTLLVLGCLVYLVCKLDNKICSIFGFQGTGSCRSVTNSLIASQQLSQLSSSWLL